MLNLDYRLTSSCAKSKNLNIYAFLHAFQKDNVSQVLSELRESGFTGVNLALNYHASRDIFWSNGPQVVYLKEGFHYYKPNDIFYKDTEFFPNRESTYENSALFEKISDAGADFNLKINAWAVYFHNLELARDKPEFTVTNVFGNHFLTDICPSSPQAQNYAFSLTKDLCSRGIYSLLLESIRFHNFDHGYHHERLFINISDVTRFLFYLCFCRYCEMNFQNLGFNVISLKKKIIEVLNLALNAEHDPWLHLKLSKNLLAEVVGHGILDYLNIREGIVTGIYARISNICKESGVISKFLDPSMLLNGDSENPLENSWIAGLNVKEINQVIDICEGVYFSKDSINNTHIYKNSEAKRLGASLTPLYPFMENEHQLSRLLQKLIEDGFLDFDFYAYNLMTRSQFSIMANSIQRLL